MTHARRRQPPSRARYAALHPTIGVHTTREMRERLVALRQQSGLSFAQLIVTALGQIELDVAGAMSRGRQAGHTDGFRSGFAQGRENGQAEAVAKYRLTYPCDVCGEHLTMTVGGPEADVAIQALARGGWGHEVCHKQVGYEVVRTKP